MAAAGFFWALTFFVYFAGCRYNYYNLNVPNENKSLRKYYFDFSGLIFYKESEINQISMYVLENYRKKILLFNLHVQVTPQGKSSLKKQSLSLYVHDTFLTLNGYSISSKSTLLIFMIICGDIHPHPGPTSIRRQSKNPCKICDRGIIKTSKFITCNSCQSKSHVKCAKVLLSSSSSDYYCDSCMLDSLPFNHSESFDQCSETTTENLPPPYVNLPSTVKDDSYEMFKTKGLHLLHLNARSVLPKMSELKLIANKTNAAILSISETWLDESVTDQEVHIENYSVLRSDRNRNGGGVCMYIRDDLAFSILQDVKTEDMESIFIELLLPKTKPIVVGSCYRPPKQAIFLDLLQQALRNIRPDLEQIILGDFNIDYKSTNNQLCKTYKNILNIFNFKQLIEEPTRVTLSSSTVIDHIICNNEERISQSGVIPTGISDHFITYCTRRSNIKHKVNSQNTVRIRSMKNYTKDILNDKLNSVQWSSLYLCRNVENAWETFRSIFHSILDDIAPFRDMKIRQHTEPWMTSEILDGIRKRDELLSIYNKDKKENYHKEFCKQRNQVQRDIKRAKEEFIAGKIEENKKSPKKLWQHLKSLGYSSKKIDGSSIVLNVAGQACHNLSDIANHFNSFFTTVASSLVDKLPNAPKIFDVNSNLFKTFYHKVAKNKLKLTLKPVSEEYIYNELKNLNSYKSTGIDNIPARFIKDGAKALAKPITYLVNLSISTGIVPGELKLARVKPLYKKNNRKEVGNYRPVSILCIISKILEKSVYMQLEKHLIENDLLYRFQSGFRSSYSTDTCLIHLLDHIKLQTSKGLFTGMVMIDLQKAFDTVDHHILCEKLKAMGINDTKWFESYLTGRKQLVNVNGVESELLNITCGVPQGSILGPLLFLCYVNDMSISINSDCKLLLYADDSTIIFSHKNPDIISNKLGKELESCSNWLVDNKLSLHLGKTECIIFGPKRKLKKVTNFEVKCNDHIIKSQPKIKYLGLEIDQHLSGESTVNSIIKKVNSRLKFMYRKANCLSKETRNILSMALIQCHFDYSCSSWYAGVSQKMKKSLQVAQNKTVRFINSMGPRDSVGRPELATLGLLNVEDRVQQLRLGHAHKIYYNKCPDYLKQHFHKVCEQHMYNTRSSQFNFVVPKIRGVDSTSFFYSAITDWNRLPNSIKAVQNHDSFKTDLKHFLKTRF